jgi:hypothetical protein
MPSRYAKTGGEATRETKAPRKSALADPRHHAGQARPVRMAIMPDERLKSTFDWSIGKEWNPFDGARASARLRALAAGLVLAASCAGQAPAPKQPAIEMQLLNLGRAGPVVTALTASVKITNNSEDYIYLLLFGEPSAIDDAGGNWSIVFSVTGAAYCLGPQSRELRTQTIRIADGYFQTIGVSLRSGVDFSRNSTEPEAIVSESVARLLGGGMPGSYVLVGESGSAKRDRVIGVAPTIRISMEDVRESSPLAVYLNFWQDQKEQRWPALFVKGVHGTPPDVKALGTAVASLGREYVGEYRSLGAARDEAIVEDRLLAYLSSVFGLLALVLAAIGLFAILSCYVSRRTSEIGVRMALGANPAQIRALVLRQIGAVMIAGIAAGFVLTLAAAKLLASIAYGVTASNPLLLGIAVLSLAATAFAAASIPASRAASIQPLDALRQE